MILTTESTRKFLFRITLGRLSDKQLDVACAYLRANGVSFYDNFTRDHVFLSDGRNENRLKILEALKFVHGKQVIKSQ